MDDILSEIGKGFFRLIGYILAEIFLGTVCYWVGYPVCKLFTFGSYPLSTDFALLGSGTESEGLWCSIIGLLTIIFSVLYFTGQFS